MKKLIQENPIVHGNLLINKLSNYQKGLDENSPSYLLVEETKLVVKELIELNSEKELEISKLLFEDGSGK